MVACFFFSLLSSFRSLSLQIYVIARAFPFGPEVSVHSFSCFANSKATAQKKAFQFGTLWAKDFEEGGQKKTYQPTGPIKIKSKAKREPQRQRQNNVTGVSHGTGSRFGFTSASHSRQPRQNHSIQTLGLEGVVDVGPRFCVACFAMWFGANASIRPARSINHKSPDRRLGLASRNERLGKAKTVLIVGREIRAAKSVEREAIKEIKRRACNLPHQPRDK